MPGQLIEFDQAVITSPTAPRLASVDLIETDGSLVLFDLAHPRSTLPDDVPTDGATIPNLLSGSLADVSGASGADLHGVFDTSGDITNGTKGLIERSGKGGIHVIVSQAVALANGDGVKISPPAALHTYLAANPTHDYYFSAWDRLTRADLESGTGSAWLYTTASSASQGMVNVAVSQAQPSVRVVASVTPGNTVGPRRTSVTVDAYTAGAAATTARSTLPGWGAPLGPSLNGALLASRNNKWPSFVCYRVYIEDLTVSGRTHGEVNALDLELYTREVLTPGGRYYDDTYTDPAMVP